MVVHNLTRSRNITLPGAQLRKLNSLLDLLLWAKLVAVSALLLAAVHGAGVKASVAPTRLKYMTCLES